MIRSNRKPIEAWPQQASEYSYAQLAKYETIEQRLSRLKLRRHIEPDNYCLADATLSGSRSANYQQVAAAGHLRSTVHVSFPHLLTPPSRKGLKMSYSGMLDRPFTRQLKRSSGIFGHPQAFQGYASCRDIPLPSTSMRMSRSLKNPQQGQLSHTELLRKQPQFSIPAVLPCQEMSKHLLEGKPNSKADRTIWKSPRQPETHMVGTKSRIQRLPVRLFSNR